MRKDFPPVPVADKAQEFEIARRIARFMIHNAAMVLSDATYLVPMKDRFALTEVVGGLNTLERKLGDLAPSKK